MKRCRLAGWLGIVFGTMLALLGFALLGLMAVAPGPATSLLHLISAPASAFQAVFAWILLKGRHSVLPVFAIASIAATFCYLGLAASANLFSVAGGLLFFAILSFVPLLILMLGSMEKSASSTASADGENETALQDASSTSAAKVEDLY